MGVCCVEEGEPTTLVFDCISFGKHEIEINDGLKLKNALGLLSKRINVSTSRMSEVYYDYNNLDKNKKIKELNLPPGSVLMVKFK